MIRRKPKWWLGGVVGLVAAALIAAGRYALDRGFGSDPQFLIPFIVPLMLASWFGRLRSSMLTLSLSTAIIAAFGLWTTRGRSFGEVGDWMQLAVFVGAGGFIAVMCHRLHRFKERAEAAAFQAEQRLRELEQEIRERLEAERRLRESERRFQALLQAAPQMAWTVGGDGGDEMGCWRALTGQSVAESDGWGWLNAIHPDDRERVRAEWTRSSETREIYNIEYRLRVRSGEYRHFALRAVPLSEAEDSDQRWVCALTDIHDKMLAKQALVEMNVTLERRVSERTSEAEAQRRLLDAVLDALPVAVIIAAPDGRVTRMNRACAQVWGVASMSRCIEDARAWVGYWPDTGQRIEPEEWAMSRALSHGETCRGELVEFERFGDRSRRLILNSASPVRGPDGEVVAGVAATMDVTDQTAAEAAMKETEERFRSAFENAPIGMALVAIDGRWLRVNHSLCEMIGYTVAELLVTDFQTITHPDDLNADLRYVDQLLNGSRTTYQMDKRYFHKQGHTVNVLLAVSLVRDDKGLPLYFVSQIKDITQRKQAERELRAQEALLRQFIRNSPAAIAMFDTDVRYIHASDRWLDDYGLVGQTVIGRSHYDVFPDIPERWKAIHQRVLGGAVERCEEDLFERDDGSNLWLQWECQPWRKSDGEIGGLIIFTQVITDRKRAEEQVKASLREKEVLLKEIHHRVKNNLQIVSTLLDLQSDHTQDSEALAMFKESRGRVKSMALIHERLYRSKDIAKVDFAEYVRQLADDLCHSYRVFGREISLELVVDIPPLSVDIAIPCGLLLNELMSNCFKHAFKDNAEGRIRVSLRREVDGANVLAVADNGVGFPSDIDFRNTTSFGMQLAHTLVDQLEGDVELTSNGWTTFTVRFPAPKK